jgi:hypothetical protein
VSSRSRLVLCATVCAAGVCGSAFAQTTPVPRAPVTRDAGPVSDDTSGRTNVPPGYGTLRQDDIAIRIEMTGLIVRAIPLDESVIRLLTPDSYRAMRELQESNKASISAVTRRTGGQKPDLWYVSFYGVQPDVHFSPMELIITTGGRDYRALDVIPLTSGFGEERLRQRETQSALYLFDESIDLDQPLTVTFETETNSDWQTTLQAIERERALIRARASRSVSH